VNVARSQSGRFPNPGPLLLVRGGVRLIDVPGALLFDEVDDGEVDGEVDDDEVDSAAFGVERPEMTDGVTAGGEGDDLEPVVGERE